MLHTGLVSISFRSLSCEDLIAHLKKCGLKNIEWGSDVHAPVDNIERLYEIKKLMEENGINCCSYGSYFRISVTPVEDIYKYIKAAKILGTNILRLWAGRKKASNCTKEEREHLFTQCRKAAALAREHDVILCLECHRRSYTETKEGALELMNAINSPNLRMYWQPNPDISLSENIEYISLLNPYIMHIHVFNWRADQRFPLKEDIDNWNSYLSALSGNHHLLLEFMPDDRIQSLADEAGALQEIIQLHTVQNT